MAEWCFNYETGEYEYIDEDGFSIDQGTFVYNWDDSVYENKNDGSGLFDEDDN